MRVPKRIIDWKALAFCMSYRSIIFRFEISSGIGSVRRPFRMLITIETDITVLANIQSLVPHIWVVMHHKLF